VAASRATYGILTLIAASTPAMLGIESLLRWLLLPPEFEEVRIWLGPSITPYVWALAAAAAVAGPVGFRLQRALVNRTLSRLDPAHVDDMSEPRARFDALILSTSVVQVPALLATLGYLLGADLLAVVVAIAVATIGVIAQGIALRPSRHGRQPTGSDPAPR
jgi:hypothetical protein